MNNVVNIGIIGCGHVAINHHLPVLNSLDTVSVVAAADIDEKSLRTVADRFHIDKRFTNYQQMLNNPVIEAVGVFVPLAYHFDVAMAVLQSEKHLLLEKPFCQSMDEANKLVAQAGKTKKVALMGLNRRWHRLIIRAREAIQTNRLGPVHLVNTASASGQDYNKVPQWRTSRQQGGGNLIENGTHYYDLWRFLLRDEIEEVYAVTRSIHSDDEPAIVNARTKSGILVNCAMSDFMPHRHETEIFGEKCVLRLSPHRFEGLELMPAGTCAGDVKNRLRRLIQFFEELPKGLLNYQYGGEDKTSFRTMWQHFIDCIQHDKPVECTLDDGRQALRIALAAVESASTGMPVKL